MINEKIKKPIALDLKSVRNLLLDTLREDGAWNDRTTKAVIPQSLRAKGEVLAKESGILAGLPIMAEIYRILDKRCRLKPLCQEGTRFRRGQKVAILKGPACSLLSGERSGLNLLSRLSGVATLTRKMRGILGVDKLFDTRKTTPLWRVLERYAVSVGGGNNHRFNLAGHVLLKDNHLRLGGGVYNCVKSARKKYGPKEFIEVEVEDFEGAAEALRAGADIILVDNSSLALLKKIQVLVKAKMEIEVSGGLRRDNIFRYKFLKVDRFSSGALTHSAKAVDFSIELYPL